MRDAIGAIRQGRYQCRCLGRPTSRRRGQVVRRLLERADKGDRIQVRGHAESELDVARDECRVTRDEKRAGVRVQVSASKRPRTSETRNLKPGTRNIAPDLRPFSSIGTTTQEAGGDFIMNVLAIDIGGTHVKILATGQDESRR